jgi:hypothetical protein
MWGAAVLCECAPQSMHRCSTTVGKACQRPALGACEIDVPWRRLRSPPVGAVVRSRPAGREGGPGALQCCGMIGAAGAVGFNGEGRTGA